MRIEIRAVKDDGRLIDYVTLTGDAATLEDPDHPLWRKAILLFRDMLKEKKV
jgi:hypothetical protein